MVQRVWLAQRVCLTLRVVDPKGQVGPICVAATKAICSKDYRLAVLVWLIRRRSWSEGHGWGRERLIQKNCQRFEKENLLSIKEK